MVKKSLWLAFAVALLIAMAVGPTVAAQSNGSIRGTVYEDLNRDGLCVGTGEPTLAGIPIEFSAGSQPLFLQSGADGTYGLVAAALTNWTVTAVPPDGYTVTSANPRQVELTASEQLAQGVDFCVARGTGTSGTTLPQSGGPVAPLVGFIAAAGIGLALLGAGLQRRRRP